jgi:predicted nucleotidyltransferase
MDKDRILEIVAFFEESLRERGVSPAKVILFGSQKTGMSHDESDIDIIVVSPLFKGKDLFDRAGLTGSAEHITIKKFLVPLDIINLTPEEFEEDPAYAQMVAGE